MRTVKIDKDKLCNLLKNMDELEERFETDSYLTTPSVWSYLCKKLCIRNTKENRKVLYGVWKYDRYGIKATTLTAWTEDWVKGGQRFSQEWQDSQAELFTGNAAGIYLLYTYT
jgi:hypothetical protein